MRWRSNDRNKNLSNYRDLLRIDILNSDVNFKCLFKPLIIFLIAVTFPNKSAHGREQRNLAEWHFLLYLQLQRQRMLEGYLKIEGKRSSCRQNALGYSWCCKFSQRWSCNS
jgi:hypothetical protein